MPLGAMGMPVPPPMFLPGGLAPYPPHYGVPGPYPAFATMPPPNVGATQPSPDTVFQGTVTIFGHCTKHTTSLRHSYGFIKVDHSGNEVFVLEADAPDGYLCQGDRCEFRIVDAGTQNRRTRARQWKAVDVVCIQRWGPVEDDRAVKKELIARQKVSKAANLIQVKAIEHELMAIVEAYGGEMRITRLADKYATRHGKPLDVRALGYPNLRQFVENLPGLIYDPRVSPGEPTLGGLVYLANAQAKRDAELKAREQALREREEAVAKREADAREGASRDTMEAEVRALIASTDRGEIYVGELPGRYRRKYGRLLDFKSLGFAKMTRFVAEVPGLELVDGPGGGTVRVAPASDDVSEALRHLSLEPKRDESKTEPVPAGYAVVAAVLQHLDETRLLPTFLAQQIDDAALPYLEPTDLIELGVAPMICMAILGASAAGGKQKKLETQDVLHDVATHQSVLEAELREHRREIARLRISREEVSEDLCCSITCELMKDPVMCVGDGHTYERVAVTQWFATGARTSPTTNERLDNLTLVPNHTVRRLIAAELERRRDASGADETKGPS